MQSCCQLGAPVVPRGGQEGWLACGWGAAVCCCVRPKSLLGGELAAGSSEGASRLRLAVLCLCGPRLARWSPFYSRTRAQQSLATSQGHRLTGRPEPSSADGHEGGAVHPARLQLCGRACDHRRLGGGGSILWGTLGRWPFGASPAAGCTRGHRGGAEVSYLPSPGRAIPRPVHGSGEGRADCELLAGPGQGSPARPADLAQPRRGSQPCAQKPHPRRPVRGGPRVPLLSSNAPFSSCGGLQCPLRAYVPSAEDTSLQPWEGPAGLSLLGGGSGCLTLRPPACGPVGPSRALAPPLKCGSLRVSSPQGQGGHNRTRKDNLA